ncbi:MAG: proprotein convertase P-domain-containing protein [Acidobacteriota bacterium]
MCRRLTSSCLVALLGFALGCGVASATDNLTALQQKPDQQAFIISALMRAGLYDARFAQELNDQLAREGALGDEMLIKLRDMTPEGMFERLWGITLEDKKKIDGERRFQDWSRQWNGRPGQRQVHTPRTRSDEARTAGDQNFRTNRADRRGSRRGNVREITSDLLEQHGVEANDTCATATVVTLVADGSTQTFSGNTCDSTDDATPFCGTGDSANGDVWFTFEGTGTDVTASLCNSGDDCGGGLFDTKIQVFSGSCGALVCEVGNDDAACGGLKSEVTLATTAGTDYFVVVFGFGTDEGDYVLDLTADMAGPGVTPRDGGENCSDAVSLDDLGLPLTVSGSTTGADDSDPNENTGCGTTDGGPGVWYSITGTGTTLNLSTCNDADFDTKLRVHCGDCDALACVGGNDDTGGCAGFTTELDVCTEAGETYLVLVFGFGTAAGDYNLTIEDSGVSCTSGVNCFPVPPPNDDCPDAIDLGDLTAGPVTVMGDTSLANDTGTAEETADDGCSGGLHAAPGVWYTFMGTGNTVNFNACDTGGHDSDLLLFCGACDDLNCVAGTDGGPSCPGFNAELDACTVAGEQYFLLVDGFGAADVGTFTLTVTDSGVACSSSCGPPENDDCATPLELEFGVPVTQENTQATVVAPEDVPGCGGILGPFTTDASLWYSITAPPTPAPTGTQITASTCGSPLDTQMTVICGTCDEPICIEGSDDDCGLQTEITWCAQPNATYFIQVLGWFGGRGEWTITVTDDGPCEGYVECIPEGACCMQDTSCSIQQEAICDAMGGRWFGDDSDCSASMVAGDSLPASLAIPDNGGISDTITMGASFQVTDVDVRLDISHTWVGDLVITLSHAGTNVTLIDRMGSPPLTFGCDQDNLDITLDDAAADPIESQCEANLSGTFSPNGSLADFNGLDSAGDWTLTITDNAGGDTGSLNGWALVFPAEFTTCVPASCDGDRWETTFNGVPLIEGDVMANQIWGAGISNAAGLDIVAYDTTAGGAGCDDDLETIDDGNVLVVNEDGTDEGDPPCLPADDRRFGGRIDVNFYVQRDVDSVEIYDSDEPGGLIVGFDDGGGFVCAIQIPVGLDGETSTVMTPDCLGVQTLQIVLAGSGAVQAINCDDAATATLP